MPSRCYSHNAWWTDTTAATNETIWYPVQSWGTTDNTVSLVTATETAAYVWRYWNNEWVEVQTPLGQQQQQQQQQRAPAVITDDERRRTAWELQQRYAREQRALLEAKQRARELLALHLSPEQQDSYVREGYFDVRSQKGRVFRVRQGRAGNVYLLEGGRPVMRYCIHPEEAVPDEDTMLVQKLMIECNEDLFEVTANKTRLAA